jgi:hypothetical protein
MSIAARHLGDLKRGLVEKIVEASGLTMDEFREHLR